MNQFLRFCAVGTIGFVIDAGILQWLVNAAAASPYVARIVSFLVATGATWLLNRSYTFRSAHRASGIEWVRYVMWMLWGALVNYAVFGVSIALWDLARAQPWLGVALGSLAGLAVNYTTSRRLVFRRA